jgi:tRNA G18 (ribose-2'-O)-methylase SpoU
MSEEESRKIFIVDKEEVVQAPELCDGRFLIIASIAKQPNVVQLVHTAIAYNFEPILVGAVKVRDMLSSNNVHLPLGWRIRWFPTLELAKSFIQHKQSILVGIEILGNAKPCNEFSFPQRVAIMPGNEGDGMNEKQIQQCDAFVYIPQHGHGTASLNVHVATTLIMHHYHLIHSLAV